MGNAGSTRRRQPHPQQTYGPYSHQSHARSTDPYAVSSEHNPHIVVHGTPYAAQRDHYEMQQRASMRSQQHKQQQTTTSGPRSAFDCGRGSGMSAQQTPQSTLLPPPPPRNPLELEPCSCATCRQKNEALAAYAANSTAANTTYVAQNQCPPPSTANTTYVAQNQCPPPSRSVASRTAVPTTMSSSCTGCTASRALAPGPSPAPPHFDPTMFYTTQQPFDADRCTTCGASSCRGHNVDTSLEHPMPISSHQKNSSFGFGSIGRTRKNSTSRQNLTQAQASPSCYDGISPSGAAASDEISEFHQECLEAHNRYRARHQNCPPLALSSELSRYAQQWAKHLASTGRLEHRQVHTYGENLYTSRGMAVNGSTVVQNWYDEIRYYDFSKPNYKPGTGHFTQVVWRESRQLGVGVVTKGDTTYVVCNYNPPGNIIGSFDSMVPQLK